MKLLITYATSEGQTRRIARFVMDHLADQGHAVEMLPAGEAGDIDPGRYDRVILAASVHAGHYQREIGDFVATHAEALDRRPVLFLSVSLAAAGHDAEDWADLDRIVADFAQATDWHPKKVVQVAGAYKPSQYDIFRRFVMRRIVAAKDPQADLEADHEYTDWAVLAAKLDEWMGVHA